MVQGKKQPKINNTQNTIYKSKDWAARTLSRTGVNYGTTEELLNPAPHMHTILALSVNIATKNILVFHNILL